MADQSWYLKRDVKAMPTFDDERAVAHELESNRAAYYVSVHRSAVSGYANRYETGTGRVLAASAGIRASRPEALYLGGGWENYLEQLTGYRLDLRHDEGDYNREGTAFLDGVSAEELARYDTVVAFGFLWHERSRAQHQLEQWVADGGTLVIDASRNLEQPTSLDGCVLFDTVIRRTAVPARAAIVLSPGFSAAHPNVGDMGEASWLGEAGDSWFGASYSELPGSAPLHVLASAGGRPLVLERKWGRGRVFWIAYNLPFHAHLTGSAAEARLVSAVLDEALGGRLDTSPDERVASAAAAPASTRGSPTSARRLGGGFGLPQSRPDRVDDARHERHEDDRDHQQLEVLLHERDVPEEVARGEEQRHPSEGAEDVEQREPRPVHPAHARHEGRERADEREEPRERDRLAAVPLEELVRLLDVLRLDEPAPLLRSDHSASELVADPVVHPVAENRRDEQHDPQDAPVERVRRRVRRRAPAVKMSESPGRNGVTTRPVSQKMTTNSISVDPRTVGLSPVARVRRRGSGTGS